MSLLLLFKGAGTLPTGTEQSLLLLMRWHVGELPPPVTTESIIGRSAWVVVYPVRDLGVLQPRQPAKEKDAERELVIQGERAGSVNEWNVAQALNQMKLQYEYQYPVFGGTNVRGGQVIDFLIYVLPRPIPLYVQGTYWHNRAKETNDLYKMRQVEERYKGQFDPPLAIKESECETSEQAFEWLMKEVGV